MTPYVDCERARELLEPFLDCEISVHDQVGVEAHLRWCQTCAARVDDLRLIGASMRGVPPSVVTAADAHALATVQAGVLARVRAERDQAFLTRVRATFSDTRLLYPALGATAALLLCFGLTYSVQMTMSRQLTDMLIAKTRPVVGEAQGSYAVAMLEPSAEAGSDQNPMRVDDAFLIPQLLNEDVLVGFPDDDAEFTFATIVSTKGRIENYELLRASSDRGGSISDAVHANQVDALLTAVRQSRFSPAQAHSGGGAVAAYMVWHIAKTTAVMPRVKRAVPAAAVQPAPPVLTPAPAPSDLAPPAEPGRSGSGSILDLTTA